MSRCPEAVYGEHGAPNTNGNCPYCGHHLGRPRARQLAYAGPDDLARSLRRRCPSGPVDETGEATE